MAGSGAIYILGAGTSKCAGGPLTSEFKAKAKSLLPSEGSLPQPDLFDSAEHLGHFRAALHLWEKVAPNSNIEEFYVLIDLLRRLGLREEYAHAPADIRYLIFKTLQLSLGRGPSERHAKLITTLMAKAHEPAFITLNWDLLLDNAIERQGVFANYGSDQIRPHSRTPYWDEAPPNHRRQLLLLKLHGSLNWLSCLKCKKVWYVLGEKIGVDYWERHAWPCSDPGCAGELEPLFVPPTSQKMEGSQPVLAEIWRQARTLFRQARSLVFVGYSFPRTDLQFKVFVNEAISRNERLAEIVVVSEPKFGSKRQEFEDHYAQVFEESIHQHKLRFRYLKFEDWVEDDARLFEAARLG